MPSRGDELAKGDAAAVDFIAPDREIGGAEGAFGEEHPGLFEELAGGRHAGITAVEFFGNAAGKTKADDMNDAPRCRRKRKISASPSARARTKITAADARGASRRPLRHERKGSIGEYDGRVRDKPIPLLDLASETRALRGEIDAAIARVLDSGHYILGAEVGDFEGALAAACVAREAVGVSSGTDALLVGLMALGVGPGDEVVTSPFTFFATAAVIVRLGATPVFADIEGKRHSISIRSWRRAPSATRRGLSCRSTSTAALPRFRPSTFPFSRMPLSRSAPVPRAAPRPR